MDNETLYAQKHIQWAGFFMLENKNITQSTEKQAIQNLWKTLFIRQLKK